MICLTSINSSFKDCNTQEFHKFYKYQGKLINTAAGNNTCCERIIIWTKKFIHLTLTCAKSTIETLEKGVKYAKSQQ